MPCFNPLKGYASKVVNPTGKRSTVWTPREGYYDLPPRVMNCTKCNWCLMKKAQEWAIRATHESMLSPDNNSFITLTYNDKFLPQDGAIAPEHPVGFMKRLREKIGPGIRSFGCAEYGGKNGRPHYHIIIFNHKFANQELLMHRKAGKLFRSAELEKLWTDTDIESPTYGESLGFSSVCEVNYKTIAYVSRYVTKKLTASRKKETIEKLDLETGEIFTVPGERPICISRRPGIGKPWLEKYKTDVFPSDEVVINGSTMRPPKYYDYLLEKEDPELSTSIKKKRRQFILEKGDLDIDIYEEIFNARTNKLKRTL